MGMIKNESNIFIEPDVKKERLNFNKHTQIKNVENLIWNTKFLSSIYKGII